ncbi:hypothetical protein CHS0354_039867 [Potamilus streckersoni]|uniref:Uncharacterized protein n=1 Tax=Potamilus streckersoni TaxID=2493646 RepID=A0AAE0SID2_9BIVA|nr:hypothetical protein CHS0354_039867 [Potamilus streckersoni]
MTCHILVHISAFALSVSLRHSITTVWADRGVSDELVEEALQKFAENRQSNTYYRSKPVTISRRNSSEPFQSLRETINMKRRNSIEAQQNMFGPLAFGNYKPSLIQAQQKEHGVGHRPSMGQNQHGEKQIGGPMGFKPRRRFSIM